MLEPGVCAKESGKRDLTCKHRRPYEESHLWKKKWNVAFFQKKKRTGPLKKKRPGLRPNAEPTPDGQEAILKPHFSPHLLLLRTACGAVRRVCVCVCARARMCIVCMYVSMCMRVCLSVCTRMHIQVHVYVCKYICTCIHTPLKRAQLGLGFRLHGLGFRV